jgi:hypothetical protein
MDPASTVSPAHSARARSLTKELRPPAGNLSAMVVVKARPATTPAPEEAVGATGRLPHLPTQF